MRAIAQLLMSIGSALKLNFLIKIAQGMTQTAVISDRASAAKRSISSKSKDDKDNS